MKQKDIAILIVIVGVSAILAVVASKIVIRPTDKKQQVEVVTPITTDFPAPDARFFNANSNDPTQPIQIGNNSNTDPFKGTQQ